MKKGNLYKVMATMMALVFISAISFAQSDKKELKKNKSMTINIEIDDDGNTTIDTIVMGDQDMEHILVEVMELVDENSEHMKEVTVKIIGDIEEGHHVLMMELSEKQKELEEAFENLQKEIAALEIEKEAKARIDQAMETLEGVDWNAHVLSLENAIIDAHHITSGDGESETIKVFIEDGDTTEVRTKVIFIGDEGKAASSQNMNVWVTDDGEKKIIIKTDVDGKSEEKVIFINEDGKSDGEVERIVMMSGGDSDTGDMHMLMLRTAGISEIAKANEAGIKIDADNRLSINNVNVEIENDDAVIGLKTNETGKMKVAVLNGGFKKLKQIKAVENGGTYEFPLNLKEIMKDDSKAKYLLIEQNKKKELMKL